MVQNYNTLLQSTTFFFFQLYNLPLTVSPIILWSSQKAGIQLWDFPLSVNKSKLIHAGAQMWCVMRMSHSASAAGVCFSSADFLFDFSFFGGVAKIAVFFYLLFSAGFWHFTLISRCFSMLFLPVAAHTSAARLQVQCSRSYILSRHLCAPVELFQLNFWDQGRELMTNTSYK